MDTHLECKSITLDPISLVTTCHLAWSACGDLEQLAEYADPLAWSRHYPEFWKASWKAIRNPQGALIADPAQPRHGHGWTGILYESVRWTWHGLPITAVDNYLNVAFEVSAAAIQLNYSLNYCVGGQIAGGISSCRMDVDRGFFRARFGDDGLVKIEALKCIRFVDDLSRRTRGQGALGAGQDLNRRTSDILGRWMEGVTSRGVQKWVEASREGSSHA